MNITTCIINDFVKDRRSIIILDQDDFLKTEFVWANQDILLIGLQHTELFGGKTHWSDLDPIHWRVMIIKNLSMVSELNDEDYVNPDNVIIKSLHFLISGLVLCIQKRTESLIELLHINRIDDIKVSYDYTATLNMTAALPKINGLRVVIDNSIKKE